MQILLMSGQSRKAIVEMVSARIGFPAKLIIRHLDEVQSNMNKARIKKAASAVGNEGLTVHEAAVREGVKLEALKKYLRIDGGNDDERATSVKHVRSYLSKQFSGLQCSQGQVLSKVLRELKDGLLEPGEAQVVIDHIIKLTTRLNRHHDEWVKRFASHITTTAGAVETTKTNAREPQVSQGRRALERMGVEA